MALSWLEVGVGGLVGFSLVGVGSLSLDAMGEALVACSSGMAFTFVVSVTSFLSVFPAPGGL
jgi:hypothetical protein